MFVHAFNDVIDFFDQCLIDRFDFVCGKNGNNRPDWRGNQGYEADPNEVADKKLT